MTITTFLFNTIMIIGQINMITFYIKNKKYQDKINNYFFKSSAIISFVIFMYVILDVSLRIK